MAHIVQIIKKQPFKVTLQLHPQPEVVASAVCQFSEVNDAVQSTIEALQYNVPIARVELLDNNSIIACNDYSSTGLGYHERARSPDFVFSSSQEIPDKALM